MINSRTKITEQSKENYRLKSKVRSMSSSLNNKKLLEDYRKSVQIKNRLSHYKKSQNKIMLKVQKYLGNPLSASTVSKRKDVPNGIV